VPRSSLGLIGDEFTVQNHRFPAIRGGRPGLRVWLCDDRAEHTGDLGGPVR
jgi:hypothetical protein